MKINLKHGIMLAILAAALYALNSPFSKILLNHMPSTLMAGFLYIGAGLGMGIIAMILLDIAAPIFLLLGLSMTTAANASLLNNFEIVVTALIALFVFKEQISPRLWLGILFVTASCMLLSFEDITSFQFSTGSVFVLLACLCWGIENREYLELPAPVHTTQWHLLSELSFL